MDTTAVLFVGALGSMVLFLTGRSLLLERRLLRSGGELKNLKKRILSLEDEKKGLEAALAESRQKIESYEKTLGARQPQTLAHILKKAKKSIKLCVPELGGELAAALPKKISARVIAGKIGDVEKLRFPCATNPKIDVALAIIDGKKAYQADGGKTKRLENTEKIIEGFESLWNESKVIS